jgi:uncharacterized membrane protein YfcA
VATSVSLPVIISASLGGAIGHSARGQVDLCAGAWMGVASVCGSIWGSMLSDLFPNGFLYCLYVGLVTLAAGILLFQRDKNRAVGREYRFRKGPAILTGCLLGLLTGVLGIGGGFLAVPLMVGLFHMPTHRAVGTSLLVILFSAIAGLIARSVLGHFDLHTCAWVVLGTIPSTQLGAWAAHRSSAQSLRYCLALVLIGILCKMVWSLVLL